MGKKVFPSNSVCPAYCTRSWADFNCVVSTDSKSSSSTLLPTGFFPQHIRFAGLYGREQKTDYSLVALPGYYWVGTGGGCALWVQELQLFLVLGLRHSISCTVMQETYVKPSCMGLPHCNKQHHCFSSPCSHFPSTNVCYLSSLSRPLQSCLSLSIKSSANISRCNYFFKHVGSLGATDAQQTQEANTLPQQREAWILLQPVALTASAPCSAPEGCALGSDTARRGRNNHL